MNEYLQKELDKNHFWAVKYAFLIIFFTIIAILGLLYHLQINHNSILNEVIQYYFKR
ncbi:MAG: hypothetical protein RLZZ628_2419 [Bacteroidota bacterium]|jgi:hypothetical protein